VDAGVNIRPAIDRVITGAAIVIAAVVTIVGLILLVIVMAILAYA
jgi:hypothetical protein